MINYETCIMHGMHGLVLDPCFFDFELVAFLRIILYLYLLSKVIIQILRFIQILKNSSFRNLKLISSMYFRTWNYYHKKIIIKLL